MDGHNHDVGKWDLVIAHPPCTYLSNAGAAHLWRGHKLNLKRFYDGLCGKALFMTILKAPCDHIAIENPVPSSVFELPDRTQMIHPWQHGEPVQKKTCLWLTNLPEIMATNVVTPVESCHDGGTWFSVGGKNRQKNRSKTFPGIAAAMAKQWGDYLLKEGNR